MHMRGLLLLLLLAGCATADRVPAREPAAYALVTFDDQKMLSSEAHGVADRSSGRPVTIDDPVRIASISKLVVALGVMRLVEAGTLDLDQDVSTWLGWELRNPAYPAVPITLRTLLSHRSSLRDGVDYAIPLGSELRTVLQAPAAFDAAHPPGAYFTYSNLNFPVVATVMEKATGERFDRLMQRLVLAPLELDACFNWTTCSDRAAARAVVLYGADGAVRRDDNKGARPACPVFTSSDACDWQAYVLGTNGALFSPQGGLRISMRELAVIGRLLLNRGVHNGERFLSARSMAFLEGAEWRFDGSNGDTEKGFYCGYGLAVQVLARCRPSDDLFGDGKARIGHAGSAYGLRSGLWVDHTAKRGAVFFAVGVEDDGDRGRTAYTWQEESLARKALRR
jgi:CubicO group peptidase (beta-lactamase class C family)